MNAGSIVPHRGRLVAKRRRNQKVFSSREVSSRRLMQHACVGIAGPGCPVGQSSTRSSLAALPTCPRNRVNPVRTHRYGQKPGKLLTVATNSAGVAQAQEPSSRRNRESSRPPQSIHSCPPTPDVPGNDSGFRAPPPASRPSRFPTRGRAARRVHRPDGGFLLPG